ncbi:MAG TPA: TIGR02680 family protein [Acidimicrobiales bacterium]|nr:TIGR02680 family protein [Acidimicrobiales bacterium]
MSSTTIPVPPSPDRWRPSRAGLISVWRYWDEVFTFHRGRLLLRGPNGSGKSLALELLLPFLLDADASPSRLTSAAKSRGGLFDRVMTGSDEPTRTGFAWVEFRRGDEVFTVGARIRASQSTRRAEPDFFTTTLSVGSGLHLLDGSRVPISRQALVEAIGDTGRVHDSGEQHRAAVREVLFPGFGADRYASVVGALLALRKEKLSQQLVNAEELSSVLSEALPPLDDHDIATVAEGFERLDRRRDEIKALEAELREVRLLADRQRSYARAVMASSATGVVSAETRRDNVTREERKARAALEDVSAEADHAEAALCAEEERVAEIGVEIEARKDSDAYKGSVALADLRSQALRLAEIADRQAVAAEKAQAASEKASGELAAAAVKRDAAAANLDRALRELRACAQPVAADAVVAEAERSEPADTGEQLIAAWIEARRSLVSAIRAALARHEQALALRGAYEEQAEAAEANLVTRDDEHRRALGAVTEATARYRTAVERWASSCAVTGTERIAAALVWPAEDPDQVASALASLRSALDSELAVARRDLEAERSTAAEEIEDLLAERARWEHEVLPDVEVPSWRTGREGVAGAPLWLLVDPVAGASPEEVDGVESALTAAGLLDAWVHPDGTVQLPGGRADVVLTTGSPSRGETLRSLLAPAPTSDVPAATVAAILESVPLATSALSAPGEHEIAIGRDGTCRLGSAFSRGPDRPARALGAPARERHRQDRLLEIDAALQAAFERQAVLERRSDDLERRARAARSELDAAPSGAPVREAQRAVADASARLEEARSRVDEARMRVRGAEDEVRAALRSLTSLSAQHGLPAEQAGLDIVEEGFRRLERAAVTWGRRLGEDAAAADAVREAELRASDASERAERAAADLSAAAREAKEVSDRVAALDASVGTEYRVVLREIERLESERVKARRRITELRDRTPRLRQKVGELTQTLLDAVSERDRADEARQAAHQQLVAVTDLLLSDTAVEPPGTLEGVSAVLGFARRVLADLAEVRCDGETIERLSERVREQVHQARTALGARVDVDRELVGQLWVLRTTAGGLRRSASELADALGSELERGRGELAEEEERLFEQTLAGSVRRSLTDRIRQANLLVDAINEQLETVRTAAAGVRVRLRWAVDPDQLDAVKAARVLLLRDPADLSDAERASLQEFIRARVDQARAELDANAPWEARLRETLDYRRWHRFTLEIAHRDWEGYQPATARRLQRLSTGERSMALHLPMIASVAAHYTAVDGSTSVCPRLILLDELFAGVDTANRAQLFGTFSAWDLDAVFTSDHEWCQYATLDGIAIHHLHPGRPGEPVTSTRFTWDGHQRRIDPGTTAA